MNMLTGEERQAAGSSARTVGRRMAVLGTAVGAAVVPAGAAQANIVGVGNAVFGNSCTNHGAAQATGTTVSDSGTASGNHLGLPLDLPRNHCGSSGIVCTAVFMSSV
ncbi:chaplin family protein [Kitasatospora sp. CB01950]|uniref:chaplin family protein n=1 Tax=Kitasatospora sp. CB01950 TaxID=1703930 RepID=UPI001F517EA4|nr:chaplin family protein [Kitasatospora sp. CB01950]